LPCAAGSAFGMRGEYMPSRLHRNPLCNTTMIAILITACFSAAASRLPQGPVVFTSALDANSPTPLIPARCPQFPAQNLPGVLCEGFDTDRNGVPGIQWSRLPLGVDPADPLRAIGDQNDDILGYTMNGGPSPFGTAGVTCSDDLGGFVGCQAP